MHFANQNDTMASSYSSRRAKEFAAKYGQHAIEVSKTSGIRPEWILAHASLESSWGDRALGNNFFGVKAPKSWTGQKQLLRTFEYLSSPNESWRFPEVLKVTKSTKFPGKYYYQIRDWFKKYPSAKGSFEDYALLINRRYKAAKSANNATAYARKLGELGYYTDSKITYSKNFASRANLFKQELGEQVPGLPLWDYLAALAGLLVGTLILQNGKATN